MSTHALFSPSGAHRWMTCPASLHLEQQLPQGDTSSELSDEGTAAHHLASECLSQRARAERWLGQRINVLHGQCTFIGAKDKEPSTGRTFEVDAGMVGHVQEYVDQVTEQGGELFVERRVDFSFSISADNAFGTADAIVISPDGKEIQVHDLKYGRGVRVDADANEQLMLYALGALEEFGMCREFERVSLWIHQPRLGHLSQWTCAPQELEEFAQRAKAAAASCQDIIDTGIYGAQDLRPGGDQCRFCRVKAQCPAMEAFVLETVAGDFDATAPTPGFDDLGPCIERLDYVDNEQLGKRMGAVDIIEAWCKAVRAKVEAKLLQGAPVPGFKLVEGRRGHRNWADVKATEEMLKSCMLREDELYERKVISPTQAEKLHKAGRIPAYMWDRLGEAMTRAEGKPSVAPESDKRGALSTANDFDQLN